MVTAIGHVWYWDCVFELLMVAVLTLISLHSYSIFRLIKEAKYKWFSYSFAVIALAFVGRIAMNLVIYTTHVRKVVSGAVIATFKHVSASDILWHYGLFTYRSFMLIGLIGIFLIITESKEKKSWILMLYLAILTAFTSMQVPYVFSLTAAVLMGLIFAKFYQNFVNRPKKSAWGVAMAFFFIFASQVTFIFASFNYSLYVAGQVIQLLGYLMLLAVYIRILRR
ncbi:hypothetical protein HOD83_01310 [Candidatus Woesearchaeota archaeon]|jgi:hypothetical protein|nr:hypothetical protein [Candidatus Woesearchaeota archaeon]MBT4248209.1 hypothetical protein [Candidatus Woesearchaeota archaeon]